MYTLSFRNQFIVEQLSAGTGETVEFPSLKVFETRMDKDLSNLVQTQF